MDTGTNIEIKIADFSDTPGARHRSEGAFSGEEFRQSILEPAFRDALRDSRKITIYLDGTAGYGTSFLEEAFGGLARNFTSKDVLNTITLVSEEESYLIDDIWGYVKDANADATA